MSRSQRAFACLAVSAVALAAASAVTPAQAFCGFYVAKADAKLFNKASKVIVARKAERTVVTMASDYQGDPKEFALVVPVPTVITERQVNVTDNVLVDHVDAYTAPRLVEYFDPDPCAMDQAKRHLSAQVAGAQSRDELRVRESAKSLGVKIEAQYSVGEYDIQILSANKSNGLATYLDQEGYRMPPGAAPVLASYIKQDMKFFVAKVNLAAKERAGFAYLRPIQVAFESPKFMLPIRLGTVNAQGPQDMLMFFLTEKGRVETTNYTTKRIPSDVEIPIFAKTEFGDFYKAMFDARVKADGQKAVYLEYAWNMAWCDPCAADPIPNDKLVSLGAHWLLDHQRPGQARAQPVFGGRPQNVFITRLHVRYDAASMPEDLMFQETADQGNFQGRYILRHPWTGESRCPQAADYKRHVANRHDTEAETMARLTGWAKGDIVRKMAAAARKPWYEEMWGGPKKKTE